MRKEILARTFAFLMGIGVQPALAMGQDSGALCNRIAATLATYLGDPATTRSGQRVEVRQCPINSEIGTIQVAAWEKGATTPSLLIDTELRAVGQLVMIPGAYALEIVSGSASSVIGIVFEGGRPRLAVRDSTKGIIVIKSSRDSMTIELDDDDRTGRKRTYTLRSDLIQ
jgi:hypothetical protein